MDQIEFVERLKKYGIDQAVADYRAMLLTPVEAKYQSSAQGQLKMKLQALSKEEQEELLKYV
ncbi:hypothetical protein [Hymenobacter fodinae]|uniref:Uncharacterized protein n=1 Tax=Hymenobacter fodinae TaxID=2510796 RepID=A0A4Z0P6J9_9BACT|nr:hypothetical protein [Hymenobacter fodinae]TGE07769.1 hypothetical protein EU556_08420 [Hymenobacter fodinae]